MRGTFSEEALLKFSELVSIRTTADFSEGETFDFTRCIRPDGSAYGTSGKCKSGTEGDRLAKNKNTAREMRKGLVGRVKSHMKMANETTDSGAKEFYKGEARAAAKKLKTLGRADKAGKVTKATTEKQANPNKEKIEKARTTYTDALKRELASYNTNDKAAIAKAKAESKEAFQAYKKEYDKGRSASATASTKSGEKERQANPGKEAFDKGAPLLQERRNVNERPPIANANRADYLRQVLDNEVKRQNRPEMVAGLKKKLAEAEKENLQ